MEHVNNLEALFFSTNSRLSNLAFLRCYVPVRTVECDNVVDLYLGGLGTDESVWTLESDMTEFRVSFSE